MENAWNSLACNGRLGIRTLRCKLGAIAITLIAGCTNPTIVFTDGYAAPKLNRKPALGVFMPGCCGVNYDGDVTREFGDGDETTLITRYFRKQLITDLNRNSVFTTFPCNHGIGKSPTRFVTVPLPKRNPIEIEIPVNATVLDCQGTQIDFVLIIRNVSIRSKLEVEVHGAIGGPGSFFSSSKDLLVEAQFVLWDNAAGMPVSYGLATAVDKNKFAVSLEDWHAVTSAFSRALLKGTPFLSPRSDDPADAFDFIPAP